MLWNEKRNETRADDRFDIFYRMEPRAMVRECCAYGGQGRRDFQQQYGVLETIEKVAPPRSSRVVPRCSPDGRM
jgi:hypothetical protein